MSVRAAPLPPVPDLRGPPPLGPPPPQRPRLVQVLGDEGFRLFFPLAAAHAALWPFLWIVVQGGDLAGARTMPPMVWHMHEMIWGAWGAALIGFLTTAFPEWTDTPVWRGRRLWALAGLWGVARLVGLVGWDALTPVAALADIGWCAALLGYALAVTLRRRTDRLAAFAGWLAAFLAAEIVARWGMVAGDVALADAAIRAGGLVFLGMLGLAISRIAVPVSNLILDPTEATAPFRPHPGRMNLGAGLVAVAVAGQVAGLSPAVTGWLMIAAGAGFADRIADHFIGRAAFRTEIVMLGLAQGQAAAGLIWIGAARLGAPLAEAGGWHLALMGGLGMAVLAVMSIAGLFHAGRTLPVSGRVRLAAALLAAATAARLAPELTGADPGLAHAAASVLWAGAFAAWAWHYLPILADPASLGRREGC